jgi:hypothetical protein
MEPAQRMSRLRTRLTALLTVWATAALAEAALYYFFLSQPYFRTFFMPLAISVLAATALETWRVLRGRRRVDRRERERRTEQRRAEE